MNNRLLYLLIGATFLEVLALTYFKDHLSKDLSAVLLPAAGMLVAVLPLLFTTPKREATNEPAGLSLMLPYILFGAGSLWCIYNGWGKLQQQPLDYRNADMLPIIKIMGERWLAGLEVYAPIPEIWEGIDPIYLPAMWMPYTPCIAAGFDIRWTNILFILGAAFLALKAGPTHRAGAKLMLLLPMAVLLYYIFGVYPTLITLSEEPIVVGFYLVFAFCLSRGWTWAAGAALACCLLSRYTIVFWAIAYLAYLLMAVSRKGALLTGGAALGTGIVLMAAGQGFGYLDRFTGLRESYLNTLTNPDERWGVVHNIEQNIGLARFFGYDQLTSLHQALFYGSLLLPLLLFTLYHFKLRSRVSLPLFALCSLKLCLVYFFSMNPMPYSYLFYPSVFMSLLLAARAPQASPAQGLLQANTGKTTSP